MSPRTFIPLMDVRATSIGSSVLASLHLPGPARVLGTTSRGVFVLCGERRVVFLSKETYRGPSTLNFTALPQTLTALPPGSAAEWDGDNLLLDQARICVRISGTPVWATPAPPARILASQCVANNLRTAALQMTGHGGLTGLLAILSGLPEPFSGPNELEAVFQAVLDLAASAPAGSSLGRALEPLLGAGRGLTPSGDDFIAGFLLACSRWLPGMDLGAFAPALIENAYRRTTTLSANLIELAAGGAADERILAAADALFCGVPDPITGAARALAYGSSSGIDALAGMAAAFRVDQNHSRRNR